MCLNTWFPDGGTVWEGSGTMAFGGGVSLGGRMGIFLCFVEKDVSKLLVPAPSVPCYDGHTLNFWNWMLQ